MDLTTIALLLAAGVAVGFINNLAGAAGAIGLVALESLLGMSTMDANASLRLSAVALGLAGLLGFISKGQRIPTKMWGYSLLTIPGAVGGALLVAPRFEFEFRLTLAALLVIMLVQQWRHRQPVAADADAGAAPTPLWLLALLFTWLGGHMGFVQIATGLVAIFVLSMVHSRDLVQINAAKLVLVVTAASASTLTLAVTDKIVWAPAITIASGAAVGSFVASRWSVAKGHGAVRVVVVAICVVVLGRLCVSSLVTRTVPETGSSRPKGRDEPVSGTVRVTPRTLGP